MNREIKFRAYRDNQMLISPISSNYGLARFFGLLYEDTKIMQYTGLKDKNGKEIYEGDKFKSIVSQFNYYYVCHQDGCFVMKYKIGDKEFVWGKIDRCIELLKEWNIFEITGNIYENPEV